MGHVFLSYSSRDTHIVERLIASLSKAGYTVWVDRKRIRGGTEWPGEIVDAIEAAAAVLVALSPGAMESHHVSKELALAGSANKLIVPVWIERTAVSKKLKYYLADIQQVDLASDFDAGLDALLEALTPIVQGKLDSILTDPQLSTREKIDAWIKVRSEHKEPDAVRIERLGARIEELWNDRAGVDAEIAALEQEETQLALKRGARGDSQRRRVQQNLEAARERGSAIDRERRALLSEQVDLSTARNDKVLKLADDLTERYDRLVKNILKGMEENSKKD
jgi:hypothetical protein